MDTKNCLNCESFRNSPEHDYCDCNQAMIDIPIHCKHYESTPDEDDLFGGIIIF